MRLEAKKWYVSVWYCRKLWRDEAHYTKIFTISFYPQHWKIFGLNHNGAVKGKDRCLDVSFWVLGFCFNFVNWNYDK